MILTELSLSTDTNQGRERWRSLTWSMAVMSAENRLRTLPLGLVSKNLNNQAHTGNFIGRSVLFIGRSMCLVHWLLCLSCLLAALSVLFIGFSVCLVHWPLYLSCSLVSLSCSLVALSCSLASLSVLFTGRSICLVHWFLCLVHWSLCLVHWLLCLFCSLVAISSTHTHTPMYTHMQKPEGMKYAWNWSEQIFAVCWPCVPQP